MTLDCLEKYCCIMGVWASKFSIALMGLCPVP